MKTTDGHIYLIFQGENPSAVHRFRNFLSRKGWMRIARGVYRTIKHYDFSREKFWNEVREEFYFDVDRDFFALFETDEFFAPT